MAYEPKQWVCGETITADALNNLETGVQEALDCCGGEGGTAPLVFEIEVEIEPCGVDAARNKFTSTHSWSEIQNALADGRPCYQREVSTNDGITTTTLRQVASASTNNIDFWDVDLVDNAFSFPDATNKVWYSECVDK